MTNRDVAKEVQKLLVPYGYDGAIDGVLGPKTGSAYDALAEAEPDGNSGVSPSLNGPSIPSASSVITSSHPSLQWPLEKDAEGFYGTHPNLTEIALPFPLYYEKIRKDSIYVHLKCAASLRRVFDQIKASYPTEESRSAIGINKFDGVYNDRNVRGGSHRSMHSYGAAIDLNSEAYPLGSTKVWPYPVIAAFKLEGWRWGGDYSGRKDPMHFEACR